MRISWTARVTNDDCLKKANEGRTLYATIRQEIIVLWSGHIMRRGARENIMITGKFMVEMADIMRIKAWENVVASSR